MGFFGTFTGEQRINIKLEAEVSYQYCIHSSVCYIDSKMFIPYNISFVIIYNCDFHNVQDPEGTRLHFEVVSGDLPKGVTLNNATGYVTGIAPDEDDIFKFTIRAIDEHGKYADAIFKMETVGTCIMKS